MQHPMIKQSTHTKWRAIALFGAVQLLCSLWCIVQKRANIDQDPMPVCCSVHAYLALHAAAVLKSTCHLLVRVCCFRVIFAPHAPIHPPVAVLLSWSHVPIYGNRLNAWATGKSKARWGQHASGTKFPSALRQAVCRTPPALSGDGARMPSALCLFSMGLLWPKRPACQLPRKGAAGQ
ncbi:hypothetical protein GQ54DRAFT_58816 [Martensiomyces pterosporus]|nr:hypothetical protein GQ54DRAFT_58816 [Martensiomyces pterosporus]